MKKICLFIIVLSVFLAVTVFAAETQQNENTQLDKKIQAFISERQAGLASIAVAVFQNEQTVCEEYFGKADIENNIPADKDTVYEWGSVSKLLVWTSVMQLYEQGKLDLNKDIRTYLPEGFLTKLHFSEPVTMLHLMNHTAGFQETAYSNENAKEKDLRPLEQTVKYQEPNQVYKPGTVTAYSNWGAALAAFIVQYVSGQDYTEYVHTHILEPLGMTQTAVSGTHNDNPEIKQRREALKTYSINSVENICYGTNVAYVDVYPAGSVISPLCDLVKFVKAFVPSDGKSPLFQKKEILNQMFSATSYYGENDTDKDGSELIPKNCHGLWTFFCGETLLGHGGNTNGCTANVLFNPQNGKGIVVLVNEVGETAFCYGLPSVVFGSYSENPLFKPATTNTANIKVPSNDTPNLTGFYTMTRLIIKGFLSIFQYTYFLPVLGKNGNGDFKLPLGENIKHLYGKNYIMDNGNGFAVFMYLSKNQKGHQVLEMESTDYIKDPLFVFKWILMILIPIFAAVSVVIIIVQIIKTKKSKNKLELTSLLAKLTPLVITVIFVCLLGNSIPIVKPFAIASAILAALLALCSTANGVYLIRKKCWFSAVCALCSALFLGYFQFWNFWGI